MITVHHLNNSRSTRVLWLLEELGVPYEIVKYERDPKTLLAPKSLEAIHPLGKSPVISDGDTTVAESGAILEYLVDTHGDGKLVPARGTQAYRDYRYFMHYAEGSLMPYLLMRLVFSRVKSAPVPFFVKPIARKIADKVGHDFIEPNLRRHLTFLNDHLAKRTWIAGDELSAADMQMSYPLEAAVERAQGIVEMPNIERYVARIKERPAYQRAAAKG